MDETSADPEPIGEKREPARRLVRLEKRARSRGPAASPTQGAILQAAAFAFMERGFADTSIDDVAARLGATKGLIYHYYRSKTDLFFAVCRHGMAIDLAAIAPHAGSKERPVTRLRRMAEAHARMMVETIAFQHVIMQGVAMHLTGARSREDKASLRALIEERDRYEALFRETIAAAKAQGDLSGPVEPALGVKAMLAVLNAPVFWYRPREGESEAERQAMARHLAFFALRGVGASDTTLEEEF